MKPFLLVLAILATVGVWVADVLLLSVPAFRNGWWTLTFFAFPAALLAVSWGGEGKKGLRIAAWLVFIVGLGGWIALRTLTGNVEGSPAVAVGDRAPDFMLKSQDGKDVRLSDLTDQSRVVLVFFRGKNCPISRGELRGLAARIEDFKASRVAVVAVGPQTPEQAKSMDLPFPVLSDPDLVETMKYGLVHSKGLMGRDVPRPTTILLSKDSRKVLWIRAAENIRILPAPEEIFEQLRQ